MTVAVGVGAVIGAECERRRLVCYRGNCRQCGGCRWTVGGGDDQAVVSVKVGGGERPMTSGGGQVRSSVGLVVCPIGGFR